MDTCPERMNVVDAEAVGPVQSEAGVALEVLAEVEVHESLFVAAVDNCPERMHTADAEGPRPPRFKTAVEF